MKHFEITISIRDARKAQVVLNDCRGLRDFISQDATNVWCDDYDENYDELCEAEQELLDSGTMDVLDEVKTILDEEGIEYEVRVWNED